MSKRFQTQPRGETRPLGTTKPAKAAKGAKPLVFPTASELRAQAEAEAAAEGNPGVEKIACIPDAEPVDSTQSPATPAATPDAPVKQEKIMKLILAPKQRKSKTIVMYNIEGRVGQVQVLRSLVGDNPPAELELIGTFAEAKTPKAKLTPAERKAARAAAPKLTLAERVAKAAERTEKLRAKLAAEQAAATV